MNNDIPRDHLVPAPVIPDEAKPHLIAYLEWLGNDDGSHGGLFCRWDRNALLDHAHQLWLETVDLHDPTLHITENHIGKLTTDQVKRRATIIAAHHPREVIEAWAAACRFSFARDLYQRALEIQEARK